jgi:hypothetical protein
MNGDKPPASGSPLTFKQILDLNSTLDLILALSHMDLILLYYPAVQCRR